MPPPPTNQAALSVRDLRTYYHTDAGFVRAVDGVSFEVPPGGSVGIAGESGSGKTQTALSILGLIDDVPGIIDGQVWVDGENLLDGLGDFCFWEEKAEGITITKDVERWRARHHRRLARVQGEKISIVFQEPMSSLIPYFTVGEHLRETMVALDGNDAARAYEEQALDLLKKLQFEDPRRVFGSYPHELSEGESQRVMLGLALLGRPHLLIADEPTSLLDAITERRVLETLTTLVQEMNLALLLIAHDLALLRVMVDQVAVMFAGKIVEWGPAAEIMAPTNERGHPYTQALLRAVPNADEQPAALGDPRSPRHTRQHGWLSLLLSLRPQRPVARGRPRALSARRTPGVSRRRPPRRGLLGSRGCRLMQFQGVWCAITTGPCLTKRWGIGERSAKGGERGSFVALRSPLSALRRQPLSKPHCKEDALKLQ